MEAYRLTREIFSNIISGKGSAIKGARWNSVGIELVYAAANRSLAMAEVAVHLSLATLPDDYVMMTIFIPDNIALKKLNPKAPPADWNAFPHTIATQAIGDQFVSDNEHCILQVPSAVTQGDYNLLINPKHAGFSKIKIISVEKFPFDKRIFK